VAISLDKNEIEVKFARQVIIAALLEEPLQGNAATYLMV